MSCGRPAGSWAPMTPGMALYDARTGGCSDGLEPDGMNLNQGAESTLAALAVLQPRRPALTGATELDPGHGPSDPLSSHFAFSGRYQPETSTSDTPHDSPSPSPAGAFA